MRYLILFLIAYLIYRYLKPMLRKPVENPHVKGKTETNPTDNHKRGNIEDAEFEELE